MNGRLVADVVLGEGTMYHPGGLDFDGRDIWVPVAEYRPNSRSIVYRVDPTTRKATEVFRFGDHLGGVACNTDDRTLHAVSWGSRWIYRVALDQSGRPTNADAPPSTLRAKQPVALRRLPGLQIRREAADALLGYRRCAAKRGRAPAAARGIDLVDLVSAAPLHQLPVGISTPAGESLTRNPSFFEAADGGGSAPTSCPTTTRRRSTSIASSDEGPRQPARQLAYDGRACPTVTRTWPSGSLLGLTVVAFWPGYLSRLGRSHWQHHFHGLTALAWMLAHRAEHVDRSARSARHRWMGRAMRDFFFKKK